MNCELKFPLPITGPVPDLEPDDPLKRIIEAVPMPTAWPANDEAAYRPCLLERRRRRMQRRTAH